MRVHYDEGIAIHIDPEPCGGTREGIGEASAGVRAGQVWSGESNAVRGADAVVAAEGNRRGSVIARTRATPRRLRPWHVRTSPAGEPGDLRHRPGGRPRGRIGKTGGRRR